MDLTLTLGLCAGLLALGALAGWRGARPPDPRKGPRMVPWRFLMLLAAAGLMIALVHLATLLGLRQDRP